MQTFFSARRTRVCALLLLCLLLFTSCGFNLRQFFGDPIDDLSDAGALLPTDKPFPSCKRCTYVAEHLEHWGFPSFYINKLVYIEQTYRDYYYKELPAAKTLAETVYNDYRELAAYVDKNDPEEVTGVVISLYQMAAGDKYAVYLNKEETAAYLDSMNASLVGIGVYITYDAEKNTCVVTGVMENGPAEEAGIRAGDEIIAAAGKTIEEDGYNVVIDAIRGKEGTPVAVTLMRDGEQLTFDMIRRQVSVKSVSYRLLHDDPTVACIRIEEFNAKTAEQFKAAVDSAEQAGVRGIIFDLRDNPGGDVDAVASVLDYLLPDGGPLAHFRFRKGSVYESDNETLVADDGHAVDLPFVVLCNAYTASAGELFTSALRDYQAATVVGTVTYGKGTAQSVIQLSDDTLFTISIATYDPPYGANYEGIGITPDISVELPDDVAAVPYNLRNDAEDTQLQAALVHLNAAHLQTVSP